MDVGITAAKSDSMRQGTVTTVHAVGGIDCPVANMVRHLSLRTPSDSAPLFSFRSGKCLTRPKFTAALRRALGHLRHDVTKFSGQSMRAGGAVSMAHAGFDVSTISVHGRWKSLCQHLAVLRHLREMPPSRARALQAGMSRIRDGDVLPAHVQRCHQRFS